MGVLDILPIFYNAGDQGRDKVIKRIILVVLSLVFLLGLVANAEHVPVKKEIWEKIPKERKFNLTTHNVLGDKDRTLR